MSPGSPGGPQGPRRIDWSRLPGADGAEPPPPADPRRPGPPPGRLPSGPVAGGPGIAGPDPTRPIRRPEGPTGPRDRVAPERASAAHDRVSDSHDHVSAERDHIGAPRDRVSAERERASAAHERATRDRADDEDGGRRTAKESESRLSQPHKRQYLSLWVELPLLLVVAFSAAVLLRTFAVQPFYIPSGSMEQTLQEGDKVLVLKLTTTMRSPQRGEVVVFRGTDNWDPEYRPAGGDDGLLGDITTGVLDLIGLAEPDEKDFIKRVIAVGGDTVSCCDADGNVVVNGVSLHEDDYVYDNAPLDVAPGTCHSRLFEEVTVPEGEVWVMGDHRGNSKDSRCQGPVPVENVIGRAIALVWPTDRATELEIPAAFDALDGAAGATGDEGGVSAETSRDGLPAAWGAAWDPPPALPATGTGAHEPGARSRRLAP